MFLRLRSELCACPSPSPLAVVEDGCANANVAAGINFLHAGIRDDPLRSILAPRIKKGIGRMSKLKS